MKILNCFTRVFWILLLTTFCGIYASDELSQDISTDGSEESDEAEWIDPEEEQELKVLPTEPVETAEGEEEKVGLTLNMPVLGNVAFYSVKDPQTGEDILKASLPGKSINLSPIPIYFDNFELIIPSEKNPSINATVTLFGKKAKLELLEAKKATAFKETPIKTKAGGKVEALSVDISLLKLRCIFDEKPSITLFPGKSLELNHIDLSLELGKKIPNLATEINMFGQPVDIQFGFTTESATIDFSLQSTQFSNIIPFVKDTPLANANLKSVIISSKYLFAKKGAKESAQKAQAIANKTEEKETVNELKRASESTEIGSPSSLALAFSARADFSAITDSELKKYLILNDLEINATYSEKDGFNMVSAVKDFGVPLIGNISEAKLIIDWSKKSEDSEKPSKETEEAKEELKLIEGPVKATPESESTEKEQMEKGPQLTISLTGNGAFNIPVSGLGELKYSLNSEYKNKEFIFGGKINESFSYASIKIASEAEFIANVSKKSVTIAGNTNVNGLDLIAKFVVAPDEKTEEMGVLLSATAQATNWQPLAKIDGLSFLPNELKDLTLKNLDASFITEKKSGKSLTANLVIKGQANILNIDVDAQVNFIKNDNQTGVFIKASVPNDKLPSAIEKMQVKDATFVLSTIAYVEPETKTKYAQGLNLKGEFDFTRDLKPLGDLLHLQSLNIIGLLDPMDIRKSKLSIQLPGIINTGTDVVSFGPLSLEVSGEPSFKLVAEVTVKPDKKNDLLFKGSAGIGLPFAAKFDLSMFGLWKNPFNLISNDFAIGNGHLGFSITAAPPPVFATISAFSLAGETKLSRTQDIKFAMSIDVTNPVNIALLGSLDGKLTLEEFVSFIVCEVIDKKMKLDDIPDISMEDIKVSFAPAATEIGALTVEEGITLKGMVSLFGKQIAVDFEVKRTGAKAQADMSPIDFGPLHITSGITAKGEKRETKLGGPSIDIEFSTAEQKFLVTGMLDLEYIFSISTDMSISRSGIDFNFLTQVGPDAFKFMAEVKGHSSGPLSDPDFNLYMKMEQNFVNFIKEKIVAGLQVAQKEVQDKINEAIRDVNSIDKQIADAEAGIDKANKNIEEWKNKVRSLDEKITDKKKELDSYKSKISGGSIWSNIGKKFKGAGNAIGDIAKGFTGAVGVLGEAAIKDAKKLAQKGIDKAEKQADRVVYAAKIIELGTEIAALEAAKATANLTLKGFQKTLDLTSSTVTKTLEASKRTAQGVLTAVKSSTVHILKAGEWTVRSLAEGFNVQRIVFDGSLKKIKNGQLPGMLFVVTILGSEKTVEFNFDFKDISKSASDLAKYITSKFIPGM